MDPPPEIVAILAAFAPLFSDRVWVKAQLLAIGALLATEGTAQMEQPTIL